MCQISAKHLQSNKKKTKITNEQTMSSFQLTGKWYLIAMSSNSCWATAFSVLPFGVYVNIMAMEEANIYEATFSLKM